MFNKDLHMNADRNFLTSEDEYEEISSAESTALTNELFSPHSQRIVHFIIDEQAKEQKELKPSNEYKSLSFKKPAIEIKIEPPEENEHFVETSSNKNEIANNVQNNNDLNITYNNKNFLHPDGPIDESKPENNNNGRKEPPPTFEELSGGLKPDTTKDKKNTLYFNDCIRRIDLVLVYEDEDLSKGVLNEHEYMRMEYRKKFQESLVSEGLELEIEGKENSYDQKTCFVKIHTPLPVLNKYAEIMHMKKPVKVDTSMTKSRTFGLPITTRKSFQK